MPKYACVMTSMLTLYAVLSKLFEVKSSCEIPVLTVFQPCTDWMISDEVEEDSKKANGENNDEQQQQSQSDLEDYLLLV